MSAISIPLTKNHRVAAKDVVTSASISSIEVASLTHAGLIREDNQDAVQICAWDEQISAHKGYLYALADGMGGYEHGGIASVLALQTLFDSFYHNPEGNLTQNLRAGIGEANWSVFQTAQDLKVRMGTTLTAAHIHHHTLTVAHIGDSRLYLIRGGKSICLTSDHTQVGEMVRARILAPDKVRHHAQRSLLNRSLGIENSVKPDISTTSLQDGDVLILCCDGVWSVIEDDEFASLVSQAPDASSLSRQVADLAIERETDDNISVIAIYIRSLKSAKPAFSCLSLFRRVPFVRRRTARGGGVDR